MQYLTGMENLKVRLAFGLRSFRVFVSLLLLFSIQTLLNQLVLKHETFWVEPPAYQEERWDPKLFRILSFGHLPLALDWFVMKSLFDPALGKVIQGLHSPMYFNLMLVSELDPLFFEVYTVGANYLAVVRKDGRGAKDLLLKGRTFVEEKLPQYPQSFRERFWRQAWDIYVLLAYVDLFILEDMPSASDSFRKAASMSGAPDYLLRLEKKLAKPGGEYQVGISLLEHMIRGKKDETLLEQLKRKRTNLIIGKFIFDINFEFHQFLMKKGFKTVLAPSPAQSKIKRLGKAFQEFLKDQGLPSLDPWGGSLSFDEMGAIHTSTPYEVVFGLK